MGRDRRRELRGPQHPARRRVHSTTPRGARAGRRPAGGAGAGPSGAVRPPGAAGPARARRQGPHRAGTACSSRCWPRRPPPSAGPTGWTPPGPTPASSSTSCAAAGRPPAPLLAGRAIPAATGSGAGTSGYAEDYAALLGALVTLAEVDDVAWLAPAGEIAAGLCRPLRRPRRVLHDRHRRRGAHHPPPRRLRQRHPVGQLAGRQRPPPPGRPHRRAAAGRTAGEAAVRAVGPAMGEHPTAFAELLGALERAGHAARSKIAVVGDPADPGNGRADRRGPPPLPPGAVSVAAAPGIGADLTPLLADRPLVDGKPTAYVCQHFACQHPVTDPEALVHPTGRRSAALIRTGRAWSGTDRPKSGARRARTGAEDQSSWGRERRPGGASAGGGPPAPDAPVGEAGQGGARGPRPGRAGEHQSEGGRARPGGRPGGRAGGPGRHGPDGVDEREARDQGLRSGRRRRLLTSGRRPPRPGSAVEPVPVGAGPRIDDRRRRHRRGGDPAEARVGGQGHGVDPGRGGGGERHPLLLGAGHLGRTGRAVSGPPGG